MKIYVAGAMSGLTVKEVRDRFHTNRDVLQEAGYTVFLPTANEENLIKRQGAKFKPTGYKSSVCCDHAIKSRDKWMVQQADILFVDLTGTERVSIGSVSEIAWGEALGKQVLVIMEKDNIHRHAFILENASIVFETKEEAYKYLIDFSKAVGLEGSI